MPGVSVGRPPAVPPLSSQPASIASPTIAVNAALSTRIVLPSTRRIAAAGRTARHRMPYPNLVTSTDRRTAAARGSPPIAVTLRHVRVTEPRRRRPAPAAPMPPIVATVTSAPHAGTIGLSGGNPAV
ncbi:hypothetical protein GCM10010123_14510 [Pilimelia anulata]|uniref:Uncharacterized protein n=1 Tax=Pilimelia anulata TaxID=53371 RepID=A0A8J3B277_9ACTN|nr:hypothetical protein GCM10010123_14510 [Pilimelia anulata]